MWRKEANSTKILDFVVWTLSFVALSAAGIIWSVSEKCTDRKLKKLFEDIVCPHEILNAYDTDIERATNGYLIFIASSLVLICLVPFVYRLCKS